MRRVHDYSKTKDPPNTNPILPVNEPSQRVNEENIITDNSHQDVVQNYSSCKLRLKSIQTANQDHSEISSSSSVVFKSSSSDNYELTSSDESRSWSNHDADTEEQNKVSNNVESAENELAPSCSSTVKRGKKRVRNEGNWIKVKNKNMKNSGKSYKSRTGKIVEARKIRAPCTDKCVLSCSKKIVEHFRVQLFNEYWKLGSLQRQRDYLGYCTEKLVSKYRRITSTSSEPRRVNCAFYFLIDGQKIRVCKTFLINTLGITERSIRTVIKSKASGMEIAPEDKRGKHGKHKKLDEEILKSVRDHIASIPRMESHHLRSYTPREFVDGGLTIAEMHRHYSKQRTSENKPVALYDAYARVFNNELNTGFYLPKKDICESYKNSDTDNEKEKVKKQYEEHLVEGKKLSIIEKDRDNEKSKNGEIGLVVYDLQAAMPLPMGQTSSFFYKSRLNCFNSTIMDDLASPPPQVPQKSKSIYEKEYKKFVEWLSQNNTKEITENVLIQYFELMGKTKKSSTLWTSYSMLRTMLCIEQNIDISRFTKLLTLLKRLSQGYEPKKSKILEIDHIDRFIDEAPDNKYLAMKLALIMGYCGACRRHELINITIDDIEYKADTVRVTVPKTRTNVPRSFSITNPHWITLLKKYASFRPEHTNHRRFFLSYHNGHCTTQPIGINMMGQIPKLIAAFLKLPNPKEYSANCFRRSSFTNSANQGHHDLRPHGDWTSSAVAESFKEASLKKKIEIAQMLSAQSEASSSDEDIVAEINDEQLISRVQEYRNLYDHGDQNFGNSQMRENCWNQIGKLFKMPGYACEARWKGLRESYDKARKSAKNDGRFTKKMKTQMAFLEPYLFAQSDDYPPLAASPGSVASSTQEKCFIEISETSRTSINGNEEDMWPRQSVNSSSSPQVVVSDSLAEMLRHYLETKMSPSSDDHLSKYFQSIEETMRTLPAQIQIRLKQQISHLVHNAELEAINAAGAVTTGGWQPSRKPPTPTQQNNRPFDGQFEYVTSTPELYIKKEVHEEFNY